MKNLAFFLYIKWIREKKFNLCDVGTMCAAKKKESIKVDEKEKNDEKKEIVRRVHG